MTRKWVAVAAGCCAMGVLMGAAPAGRQAREGDLRVERLDPDPAPAGGLTVVHAFVYNSGQELVASAFTVTVTLPVGTQPQEPYFPKNCQTAMAAAPVVRCSFPAGLRAGQSATATVPVRLCPDVQGVLVGSVRVESVGDPNPSNDVKRFDIVVSG